MGGSRRVALEEECEDERRDNARARIERGADSHHLARVRVGRETGNQDPHISEGREGEHVAQWAIVVAYGAHLPRRCEFGEERVDDACGEARAQDAQHQREPHARQ